MPLSLGKRGDAIHDDLVIERFQQFEYFQNQTQKLQQAMTSYWKIALSEGTDPRSKSEKLWRANTTHPWAPSSLGTRTTTVMDIFGGADPLIQAEPRSLEAEEDAEAAESIMDYQLRSTNFLGHLSRAVYDVNVQGTGVMKLRRQTYEQTVWQEWGPDEEKAFQEAIQKAANTPGVPPPPDPVEQPDEFEQWRELVNKAGKGDIPEKVEVGPKNEILYRGPAVTEMSIRDLYLDPFVGDMCKQPLVIQRTVLPNAWVEDMARRGEYDKDQVAGSINGGYDRLPEWEQKIAEYLGLTCDTTGNPMFRKSSELLECWAIGSKWPYTVILNREAVVNIRPFALPPGCVGLPYLWLRQRALTDRMHGLPIMKSVASMVPEMIKGHNRMLDALTLSTIPTNFVSKTLGVTDAQMTLVPGAQIPVNGPVNNAVAPVFQPPQELGELTRELDRMDGWFDAAMDTGGNIRGATAQVGRISATAESDRLNRAIVQLKDQTARLEEDLDPMISMSFWQWRQEMRRDPDFKLQIAGRSRKRPVFDYKCEDFLRYLRVDIKFRGATMAINRAIQAQQLQGVLTSAAQTGDLTMTERRLGWKRVVQATGTRDAQALFSAPGDKMAELADQVTEANAQVALLQARMSQMQMQAPPQDPSMGSQAGPGAAQAPTDVSMGQLTGQEAPAPEQPPPSDVPAGALGMPS